MQKFNVNILSIILVFCITSCSTVNKSKKIMGFNDLINSGNCEQAALNLPNSKLINIMSSTKKTVGTAASYFLTGLTYGAETVVKVTGGIVASAAICSPTFLLGLAGGSRSVSSECYGKPNKELWKYLFKHSLGKKVYKKTSKLRCPKLDHISINLRKVASCYKNNKNYSYAKLQLTAILKDSMYRKCLSKKEYLAVQMDLAELD